MSNKTRVLVIVGALLALALIVLVVQVVLFEGSCRGWWTTNAC